MGESEGLTLGASALDARQMTGFKDFYQYVDHTRVIAGRGLLESAGFEFMKEGASRVFIVTDEVIRGTGLVDKVQAGVEDGGLEVAGIFDGVPQDSSTVVVEECAAARSEEHTSELQSPCNLVCRLLL